MLVCLCFAFFFGGWMAALEKKIYCLFLFKEKKSLHSPMQETTRQETVEEKTLEAETVETCATIVHDLTLFLEKPSLDEYDIQHIHELVKKWLQVKNLYKPVFDVPSEFQKIVDSQLSILQEFTKYCQSHSDLPRLAKIDLNAAAKIDADKDICWRVILLRMCNENTEMAPMFPKTMECLKQIDSCTAFFSVLEPKKQIPEHVGYNCMFLRYHLGLIVPEGCHMVIDEKKYKWDPDVLFDDTFPHSVSNPTDQFRVILLLDIVRDMQDPDMNLLVRKLVEKTKSSCFVQGNILRANKYDKLA